MTAGRALINDTAMIRVATVGTFTTASTSTSCRE